MRTAATADGRLLGRDVECWFDTGAYADNGPRVTATGGDAAPGPTAGRPTASTPPASTRTPRPSGSYRAFGATHLQWIGESQVDEVARRCGLDPLEIRRANLCTPGEESAPGGKPLDADLVGDVEKVAAAVGWGEPKAPKSAAASRSGCSRPARIRSRRAIVAHGGRRRASSSSSARPRWARARARRSPRSPREVLGLPLERVRVPGHRHALHALRPLDRRQPLDDAGRARGAAGRADVARTCATQLAGGSPAAVELRDGAAWHGASR